MKLYEQIQADMKDAMKAKDENKVLVLRMLFSALKNKGIELKSRESLSDDDSIAVVKSEIKKRKDAIETYKQGSREDLAEKEQAEIVIIEKYMPEMIGEAEIERVVREVIDSSGIGEIAPSDFGKIMGQAMLKLKGQADGNVVSQVVKKLIG